MTIPHFFIGAGIGAVDASLVPLLARLVDDHHGSAKPAPGSYGMTFALGQTAVSLAYCLGIQVILSKFKIKLYSLFFTAGPLLGGALVESIRFPMMMILMGILNITFSPVVLLLKPNQNLESINERTPLTWFQKSTYGRLENE